MAEITVSKLGKSFGINEIFSDISFNLEPGDKIGIVGPNGAGKTTLFNILTGRIDSYEGNLYIKNNYRLGYMLQNVHSKSEKTVFEEMLDEFSYIFEMENRLKALETALADKHNDLEEINNLTIQYNKLLEEYHDFGGAYYESRIEGMLKGMGFPKERFNDRVSTLSGGEKSRLELAKLLISNYDVLLLDEPTNHLDMETIEFVESILKDSRKALIFISHDRYFLERIANRIFLLEKGKLNIYNMPYSKYMDQRKKDIIIQQRAYENQQKEIARQEEIIDRFARAGGSLRKRGIAQARSRQKLVDKMKRLDRPDIFDDKMKLRFFPQRESGEDVLKVENLSMSFENKKLFQDISFNIYKGEKIGLIGANGTGKTTIFKIILNKLRADSGDLSLGAGVFPQYFDQEQAGLNEENTVIDEVWDAYPDKTHYEIRAYLAKFMFIGDDIFKLVGDLSGGERARITLLKLMLSSSNFLLMDEPTNHLDIDSKEVLEDALKDYEATALIISHDRYFLNKVCDRIILLDKNTIEEFYGNYDYYLEKLEERKLEVVEFVENKTKASKEQKKLKKEEKEIRKQKAKIRELETLIRESEEEISKLNEEFIRPEVYQDHIKAGQIQARIDAISLKRDEYLEEWLLLAD